MKGRSSILAVGIIVFFCGCLAFSTQATYAQKEGGYLKYPLTAEPRPLDPQHFFNEKNCDFICEHMYENLIWVDKELKLQPSLATSWEMGADYKSCVFRLRKGVEFHDGTPFNAKAVAANFDRIVKDKPNAFKFVDAWFQSADILDDYTVRINLKKVYAPFLTEMAQIYTRIISPKAIQEHGLKLGNNPSGTGPWKFSKWNPGESVTVVRNQKYWKGSPKLEGIIFKVTPDETSRMMGFESGSFDVPNQPQYMDIERLEKSGKYKSHTQPSSELYWYNFNLLMEPFDQKEVRHAIAHAINKPLIVRSQLGENVIIAYGFGPVFLPDTLKKEDAYGYDPQKAKEMLSKAGWKPGPDGILVKDGKKFQFKIMTPFGRYPMDKQITEAIQANLKSIGIDAEVNVVESAAFIKYILGDPETKKKSGVGHGACNPALGGFL